MYKYKDCKESFVFPETKNLDVGHGEGILGLPIKNTMKFCPFCMSVNINLDNGAVKMGA